MSRKKRFFSSIKFDFFIFQRWFEGVRSYMQAKRSSNQDKYPRGNMKKWKSQIQGKTCQEKK